MTSSLSLNIILRPSGRRVFVTVPARIIPKAHDRNTLRRRIRASARRVLPRPPQGKVLVFTVRSAEIPQGRALDIEVLSLIQKSGIIKQ